MKKSEVLSLLLCYNFEREFKKFSDKFIIKIDNKKYPDYIFYFIEDKLCVKYNLKTGNLWCKYWDFWEYFKTKFNFNDKQIRYLIKYMAEKHFKLKEVTPFLRFSCSRLLAEKHFKLKEVTPGWDKGFTDSLMEEHFKLNILLK